MAKTRKQTLTGVQQSAFIDILQAQGGMSLAALAMPAARSKESS
ncbi:hypothetical protein [Agathobaculum sp.]|nr:hypothetical protein [Agathobaculum sp.]